jgi:hypothetical protein
VAKVAPPGASFGAGLANVATFLYEKVATENSRERYTAIDIAKSQKVN